jgi:hypothetical protein
MGLRVHLEPLEVTDLGPAWVIDLQHTFRGDRRISANMVLGSVSV